MQCRLVDHSAAPCRALQSSPTQSNPTYQARWVSLSRICTHARVREDSHAVAGRVSRPGAGVTEALPRSRSAAPLSESVIHHPVPADETAQVQGVWKHKGRQILQRHPPPTQRLPLPIPTHDAATATAPARQSTAQGAIFEYSLDEQLGAAQACGCAASTPAASRSAAHGRTDDDEPPATLSSLPAPPTALRGRCA
jgi:hypothetical protein